MRVEAMLMQLSEGLSWGRQRAPLQTGAYGRIFLAIYQNAFPRSWQARYCTNDAQEGSTSQEGSAHPIEPLKRD